MASYYITEGDAGGGILAVPFLLWLIYQSIWHGAGDGVFGFRVSIPPQPVVLGLAGFEVSCEQQEFSQWGGSPEFGWLRYAGLDPALDL